MANVTQNLRNRLNKHIQTYTRNRVNQGSANSRNFVNTINEIINVIHRGKVPRNSSNHRSTGNNINRILNENANFRELMSTNDPERRKRLLRKLQLKHHPNKGGVNGVFNRLMKRAGTSNNNRGNRMNNSQLALRPGNNNRQLALIPGNPINRNGNTFYNARSNQPWLKNMAQMRGAALMNNERRAARNL